MDKFDVGSRYRSARWYEWLLVLLLLALVSGVRAESVYKCTGADGTAAYQMQPCGPAQRQSILTPDVTPAYQPSPKYAVPRQVSPPPRPARRTAPRHSTQGGDISYECRVADGEVFYRHSPCPHTMKDDNASSVGRRGARNARSLAVTSRAVPRAEACAQMRRAGTIGRVGHEHDETVSTYERDLGNDPCG